MAQMEELVRDVRIALMDRDVTSLDAATLAGVSRSTFYNWLQGRHFMAMPNIIRLVERLGMELRFYLSKGGE